MVSLPRQTDIIMFKLILLWFEEKLSVKDPSISNRSVNGEGGGGDVLLLFRQKTLHPM